MKIYKHLIISLIIFLLAWAIGVPIIVYQVGYLDGYFSGVQTDNCGGAISLNEPSEELGSESDVADIVSNPVLVEDTTDMVNPSKEEVDYLIDQYVSYYKADPELAEVAREIIHCESTYRHYDSQGNILLGQAKERGLCQFKSSTFYWYSSHYGWKDANIDDWKAQVRLLIIMLSEGKGSHWSCY